jgi:carboxymethylenebutenolidase
MNGETIELRDGVGNAYRTYIAQPKGGRGPGVVIGLDIFGLRPLYPMTEVTRATMEQLKPMMACNGKVAVTGFCVGGNTAFIAAARFGADAAASYYGTRLHTLLDEVGDVKCPTLLHIAEHDETYPDEERDKILAAVAHNLQITPHIYAAPHGFASSHIVEEAKALAHGRTFALFDTLK